MLFLITGCRLFFNTVKTRVDDKSRSRGQSGSGAFKCNDLRCYRRAKLVSQAAISPDEFAKFTPREPSTLGIRQGMFLATATLHDRQAGELNFKRLLSVISQFHDT